MSVSNRRECEHARGPRGLYQEKSLLPDRLQTSHVQRRGQTSGMREGINSGRLCANFPLKITHKSVKGDRSKKKEKKKENSRLSEYKAHSSMGILFIYLSILSFTEKVHALVRKLGSDSVKAHHLQRLHIRRFLPLCSHSLASFTGWAHAGSTRAPTLNMKIKTSYNINLC